MSFDGLTHVLDHPCASVSPSARTSSSFGAPIAAIASIQPYLGAADLSKDRHQPAGRQRIRFEFRTAYIAPLPPRTIAARTL